jgi:predicted nucleic acid-binding protein
MKPRIYLDTTIPSYLVDEREELKMFIDITQQWWQQERQYFEIWVSEAVFIELNRGNYPNKVKVLESVSQIAVLPFDPRIEEIVRIYLENYLMPRVLEGDARHLAYASFYEMDFLLTWNCNHLANANKMRHIRVINTRLGLHTPDIVTPLTLFTEAPR